MKKGLKFTILFIILLWGIRGIDILLPIDFSRYGILPRTKEGLLGIIFSPLIHANLTHLISNTIPLFILMLTLFIFYKSKTISIIILSILFGGILVWTFARNAFHIGASGLVNSIAAFLITGGIVRRDLKSLIIAIVIISIYGGTMIWGILPVKSWVSWEGHLFHIIAGIVLAYFYRNIEIERNDKGTEF